MRAETCGSFRLLESALHVAVVEVVVTRVRMLPAAFLLWGIPQQCFLPALAFKLLLEVIARGLAYLIILIHQIAPILQGHVLLGGGCFDCSMNGMRLCGINSGNSTPPYAAGIPAVAEGSTLTSQGFGGYSWVAGNLYCAIYVYASDGNDSLLAWAGEATNSGSFATTYTRVAGCCGSPASVTLG